MASALLIGTAYLGNVAAIWPAGLVDTVVFLVGAVVVLGGALGVIWSRNPIHSAMFLVTTLFGVAMLFVSQQAHFLAIVQVIVYAGAIVVLFVFVIMLLGVDTSDVMTNEPERGHGSAALVLVLLLGAEIGLLSKLSFVGADPNDPLLGKATQPVREGIADVEQLAEALFSRYVLAFEITSLLLLIAVVGAVVLARRPQARRGETIEDELGESEADPEALEVV